MTGLHVDAIKKLLVVMVSLVVVAFRVLVCAVTFVLSLSVHVHGVVSTLCESILPLTVMGDDRTEDSALEILGNAPNDDAVGTWRFAVVDAVLLNWKFQIWLVGVTEGEVLVVVVGVRVCNKWSISRRHVEECPRHAYTCLCLA